MFDNIRFPQLGNHRVFKSALILAFIVFIFTAGFLNLFAAPYSRYLFPWTNWPMFNTHGRYHYQLVVQGFRAGQEAGTVLPLEEFFPMNPIWINRGGGVGIESAFGSRRFQGATPKAERLCNFILDKSIRAETHHDIQKIMISLRLVKASDSSPPIEDYVLGTCGYE